MPGKPSISSVHARPGEGPLIITLAAMLLINMTAFCVVVGFDDLNRNRPTATPTATTAAGPSAAAASATLSPVIPRVGPPITSAELTRPSATAPASVAPAVDVSPAPVPASVPTATAQVQADDDAPLTFFGVPVH